MKKFILLLIATLAFAACEQKSKEKTIYVGKEEKSEPEQSRAEDSSVKKVRAEKLVAAAEQLFSHVGFMYADEILDKALKADPSNRKARFYKAFLAPAMKLRGLNSRMKTLDRTGVVQKNYEYLEQIGGGLKEFFNQAAAPFNSEADAQKLLLEVYQEQEKLNAFIKDNKTWVTRLTVPFAQDQPEAYNFENGATGSQMIRNCVVTKISKDTYRVSPCPYINMLSLRTNRGDWEAIQQSANASRVFATFALSYDPTGLLDLAHGKFETDKQRAEKANQLQNLGKLLSPNYLAKGIEHATEVHAGMKWILENQNVACNKASNPEHVFRDGVCTSRDVEFGPYAYIKVADANENLSQSLSAEGGVLRLSKPHISGLNGQAIHTLNFNALALFKRPVANLKSLVPNKFDSCGAGTDLADPTFGGMFKDGNANHFWFGKRADCTLPTGNP